MFEVTIREIMPDGSRVPVVRDGEEYPTTVELEGLAMFGIVSSTEEYEECYTVSLNLGVVSLARMLAERRDSFRASALLAAIRITEESKKEDTEYAAE